MHRPRSAHEVSNTIVDPYADWVCNVDSGIDGGEDLVISLNETYGTEEPHASAHARQKRELHNFARPRYE